VRVRRILCADKTCVVTENEWRGTHLGTFMGWPATGKPVRMRAIVVWHFKGDSLWGETIFFDNASLLRQIGAEIEIPPPTSPMEAAAFTLDDRLTKDDLPDILLGLELQDIYGIGPRMEQRHRAGGGLCGVESTACCSIRCSTASTFSRRRHAFRKASGTSMCWSRNYAARARTILRSTC
jgi:hypothetical protein